MRVAEMIYWITQREVMRRRREDPYITPSWRYGFHDDPNMGSVRYCNVRREDDKVTRWLSKFWRPMWKDKTYMMVLARMLNYIPTLEILARAGCTKSSFITDVLKERRAKGEKVFTGVYTISTSGQRMDKIDYVMGVVDDARSVQWEVGELNSLDLAHRKLQTVRGLGSFLAAQVLADLKNTDGHPLQHAHDWAGWSAPGPGSLKGLTAFYGTPITVATYHRSLDTAWRAVKLGLSEDLQDLHMQDFQNCMCEFSKYVRVKEGGRARNTYHPGHC